MIRGLIEWFLPDDEVRFKTFLKRVARAESQEYSDDIRELIPSAIMMTYTTFTFNEIMNMKLKRVETLLNKSNSNVNGFVAQVKRDRLELGVQNILANSPQNVIVNTNCKLFWEEPVV